MVKLKNIRKSFGSNVLLGDVTLTVKKGELVILTGSSGCGKTTMLNIVSGIVRPDSGSVYCGSSRLGYAFQKDILIPWMSALENIVYVLKRYIPENEVYGAAYSWMEKTGLGREKDLSPSSMSGGMKKRLNIARAMSVEPDILLLDEPFAYLDDRNISDVKNLIRERISTGKSAVILVTHDTKQVDDFDGRRIEMRGNPVVIEADE